MKGISGMVNHRFSNLTDLWSLYPIRESGLFVPWLQSYHLFNVYAFGLLNRNPLRCLNQVLYPKIFWHRYTSLSIDASTDPPTVNCFQIISGTFKFQPLTRCVCERMCSTTREDSFQNPSSSPVDCVFHGSR